MPSAKEKGPRKRGPSRVQGSRSQKTQDPKVQGSTLRNEGGHRAIAAAGTRHAAGAELELVVAEAEERRLREVAIRIRSVLVAGAVGVQLLPADVAFRVDERHAAERERAEAELVRREALACATDGTATVAHAVLDGDDQDVALLHFGDQVERVERASRLLQVTGPRFAFAVVVEVPRLPELLENEVDSAAVLLGGVGDLGEEALGDGVHRRDREPAFGALRQLHGGQRLLDELAHVAEREAELLREDVDLRTDRLRTAELLRVRVAGLHLLVRELVGDRQVLDELDGRFTDAGGELVAVFDHALGAGVVEADLFEDLIDRIGAEAVDLLQLAGGGLGLLSNRIHCVISMERYCFSVWDCRNRDQESGLYNIS